MTKKPKIPETPNAGGSYVRNPKTGKVKLATKPPAKTPSESDKTGDKS